MSVDKGNSKVQVSSLYTTYQHSETSSNNKDSVPMISMVSDFVDVNFYTEY